MEFSIISIFGILFLIFRVWLVFFKLREELQFRRFYVSRLVNIYFCLMLVFDLKNEIFNVIVATCLPAMLFTSIWDYNFYKGFKKRKYWEKNRNWLLLERITMHPPILIGGLLLYMIGLQNFLSPDNIKNFIYGIILTYGSSFLCDVRLKKKFNWPNGRDLFIVMLISTIGFSFYYIFG